MEDAGLFGMFIVTDDYREKVLHMKKDELESVQGCMNWLQEHNIWSRVYKTNWEKLQQEMKSPSAESLLPFADSADIMLGNSSRASTALGHNEMMLATVDLSQYKGQYSKRTPA